MIFPHFVDMYVERNYLLKYVYPKLTVYCRQRYDLEFQVIYRGAKHATQ